jgi:hypothetical protein
VKYFCREHKKQGKLCQFFLKFYELVEKIRCM